MSRTHAVSLERHAHCRVACHALVALALTGMLLTTGCDSEPEVNRTAPVAAPAEPRAAAEAPPAADPGGRAPVIAVALEPVREGEFIRHALPYPTGERESSAILLEKVMPAEVRVGEPYTYTINVTNLTDAILSGVAVFETLGPGVEFDSSVPPAERISMQQNEQQNQQGNQQQQGQAQQAASQQRANQQQQPGSQQPGNQQQANQQGNQQQQANQQQANQQQQQQSTQPAATQQANQAASPPIRWFLGELPPRATRAIRATAVAGEPGQAASCLAVTYAPTLCTAIKVVQPQLRVTKSQTGLTEVAGEGQIAYLCDTLKYQYTVTNTGTGTAKDVVVEDPLPDGLRTAEGQQQIVHRIGDLPAGETKQFEVAIRPARTGEFASRAVARSEAGEAYSSRVTTPVREPNLAVEVNGPQWQYVNQPVTFSVRVRNEGDVPARNTTLTLQAPGLAEEEAVRKLGDLPAGETRTVDVTVRPTTGGDVKFVATATSVCEQGEDATGALVTAIRTIPALVLEMVDNNDPVQIGDTTVYSIAVKNQGSGPAKNVSLEADLPQGFEFVEGSGQTEVKNQGGKLTFGAIEQLAPGEVANWYVEARPTQAADARFEVRLNSEYLDQPVPEVEPTRAIEVQQAGARQTRGQ